MAYKCGKCGAIMDSLPSGFVRCSVCANKVLYKIREPVTKTVSAV